METWTEGQLYQLITKVFKTLMQNILEGKGGNDLVEMKCGAKQGKKGEDVSEKLQNDDYTTKNLVGVGVVAFLENEDDDGKNELEDCTMYVLVNIKDLNVCSWCFFLVIPCQQ